MAVSVLVGYGTKRGSTREVAEAVAEVLRGQRFEVTVLPAGKARKLDPYDQVVIGGALYRGRWHHHAMRLLKRLRKQPKPVAVFGMGPRRNEPIAFERADEQLRRALAKVPEVKPLSVTVFGGADREKGVDIRDWNAIRAWADEVGRGFQLGRP